MTTIDLDPPRPAAAPAHGDDHHARREAARRACIPFASEYPFVHRFLDVGGGTMHYLDEGPRDNETLLFLHGNPTWSFLWRRLVRDLSTTRRCIAVDHIGCGLSDKPQDWPYTLEGHIANVERLCNALALGPLTLVVHDWGGAIGLGFARRHPHLVRRLVILNSAAFPSPRIPLRIALCRTPGIGSLLVRRFNAFAGLTPRMAVHGEPLNPIVRRGFLAPYDSYANRIANWRFVQDIPMRATDRSWPELVAIDAALPRFADRPVCLVWGMRDFCFTPHFLGEWRRRFPDAEVHEMRDAGHLVLEDAPLESVAAIRSFLERTAAEGARADDDDRA